MTQNTISRRALLGTASNAAALSLLGPCPAGQASETATPAEPAVTLIGGEVGASSVLLQARFSAGLPPLGRLDVITPGLTGTVRFDLSETEGFAGRLRSRTVVLKANRDGIARAAFHGLHPGTIYHYRAELRAPDGRRIGGDQIGRFQTLPAPGSQQPVSFAVISCLNYEKYFGLVAGGGGPERGAAQAPWSRPAEGAERERGYPALDVVMQKGIQFVIATGDTVYYDPIAINVPGAEAVRAKTVPQMRASWHRQFAVPVVRELLSRHATFWMKDDHDFRFDDGDRTGALAPLAGEGSAVFLEQVPAPPLPYRSVRLNQHAQLWLLEGRDYRTANDAPDDGSKSLWGTAQRRWLEESLLASDAPFRIIVSPGPLIGPDDARKKDNHANIGGFHSEGEAFLRFLAENGLATKALIVTGDRHWQYHSVHPTGIEEVCCGTVHRQNARNGVRPGQGSDPQGLIRQPYLAPRPEGGVMQIIVQPSEHDGQPALIVRLWSETGELRHELRRTA